MRFLRWRDPVSAEAINARMRRLLGAPTVPARTHCHLLPTRLTSPRRSSAVPRNPLGVHAGPSPHGGGPFFSATKPSE